MTGGERIPPNSNLEGKQQGIESFQGMTALCRLDFREFWVLAWRAAARLVPCLNRGMPGTRSQSP
jgi:hypothetical protein